MEENYVPGFTPALYSKPVRRMAVGGRLESGLRLVEGRDRDAGEVPFTSNLAASSPAVAQTAAASPAAMPTAYQSHPTAQPLQTAPYTDTTPPATTQATPQYKWGVISGPPDQQQFTVNFKSKKKGEALPSLTVGRDTQVIMYDHKNKKIITSGIGFEGAEAAAEAASRLAGSDNDNWWDIYTGPAGATKTSQFKVAIGDPKRKNFGERFLDAMGTLLPIATAFIPGLNLVQTIAVGAAAGGAGAALKGQDILKGVLTGGATAGLMNAPFLGPGKSLSGVVGGALQSVPVVGDALKGVSGLVKGGGSTWNPLTETITTTATKSAAPALISGGLTSGLQGALNTAAKYPGTVNYADQVYDKTLEDQFDGILVKGGRTPAVAPAVSGVAGGVAGTVPGAGTYYKDENLVEVAGDKTKPKLDDAASGAAQAVVNEFVDPNEIVVSNKYKPPSLDDLATGAISSLAPSVLQPGPQAPTTDANKKLGVEDYLRIAGLLASAFGTAGKKTPSDMSGLIGARGPLSPVFSASLPSANLPAATARPATALPRSTEDWYRYGYGPEQSFFSNVPQGAPNTSTAYTGYAEGGAAGTGPRSTFAVGGPGDGRDDKIPALLSDGEYVMDAETVAMLGNGSSKAGAEALDKFRVSVRKHKGRDLAKGKFSAKAKKPEQYLKGRK